MRGKKTFWFSFGFYSIIYLILFIISSHFSFFWDKDILDSVQAHWLLDTGFDFSFPNQIDSGHPPVMSLTLAVLWYIFGKHLIVGHILMFFISLGVAYQVLRFIRYFLNDKYLLPVSALVLLDTSVLTQSVVVSGDLVLFFFFFLAINSILYRNNFLLLLGVAGLCIINMRGLLSGGIVFGFHFYLLYQKNGIKPAIETIKKNIPVYLLALILPAIYYIYHYVTKGWLMYYPESPWAGCYEVVSVSGFLRNIVIVIWRFLDFGRVFLWGFSLALFLIYGKSLIRDEKVRLILTLFLFTLLVYVPPMLRYNLLSSHRYILPSIAVFAVLTGYVLFHYVKKRQWIIFLFLFIGLQSGHFWIYPEKLAQGWDATMAHIPYYQLKRNLLNYLDENDIPLRQVGAVTPNKTSQKFLYLNNMEESFTTVNLDENPYVFYSNIMNDFTDEQIDELNHEWILVKEFSRRGVFVKLYRNPKYQ